MTRSRHRSFQTFITLAVSVAGSLAAPAVAQPGATPAVAAQPPEPARPFTTADELLDALATADKGLASLTARVRYVRNFGAIEGGEVQIRSGTLWFLAEPQSSVVVTDPDKPAPAAPPSRKRFAIDFTTLQIGSENRKEEKSYIFDGEWFIEKDAAQRQIIKRRVVPAGEIADPLRIGQGPFPIPIGQRKQEILARFDVTLVDPLEGIPDAPSLRILLATTYQLKLVPKPNTDEANDFREVRIWYRTTDLLPRMARTIETDGSAAEVLLIEMKRNPLDHQGKSFVTLARFDGQTPEGWAEQVDDLPKPSDTDK
ncbi:MAG: hypothetical protein H7Y88_05730 [Phycisphaerales bacterium]|nr:hypothetical protein [Phycisphaerales bacterium]